MAHAGRHWLGICDWRRNLRRVRDKPVPFRVGRGFNSLGNEVWIGTARGREALGVNLSDVVIDEGNLAVGGTKSAVVDTQDGRHLLYAEESTEVWFTDYGFGRLAGGTAQIAIDPIFAQTVNLDKPYHVFVQVYGDADVYVTNRTTAGFEVRLREGDATSNSPTVSSQSAWALRISAWSQRHGPTLRPICIPDSR